MPDEVCAKLEELRAAGVEYDLLTVGGGVEQRRRFMVEFMPIFARGAPVATAAE